MALNYIQNYGEIDQSDEILQVLNYICMNSEHSDVSFIVENTKIPAHKTILSARSIYFQTLFCGGFAEANQNVIELRVPLNAFKAILKYIYTGYLSLTALEIYEIIQIYDLANQYGFDTLKKTILEYLTVNLTLDNCISILNAAYLYSLDDLQAACMNFMDCHSNELLERDTFKDLLLTSLCNLLKRDTFYAPEIEIFKAICNWSTNNPDADIKEALSPVRWSELSRKEVIDVVFPSNVLDRMQILNLWHEGSNLDNPICRIPCSEKGIVENVATIEHGATTIAGEHRLALLNGNFTDYGFNRGCTFHSMGSESYFYDDDMTRPISSSPIIVDLGKVKFINNIKMLLMDKDARSYSYYIDVSVEGKEYTRLIDHTDSYHRSWQNLYFQSRPVRFIKLAGTRVTGSRQKRAGYKRCESKPIKQGWYYDVTYDSFDVVGLQAIYTTIDNPEWIGNVIKPRKNVAKTENGATVIRGSGDGMLNENPDEFTCHEKDSYILLKLIHPHFINSLRMLLGNSMNHSNKYSFNIETSMDKTTWEPAVDKRNETLSGWQEFDFDSRPAMYIKITGTQSDVTFICTYFECPRNPQRPKLKRPLQ